MDTSRDTSEELTPTLESVVELLVPMCVKPASASTLAIAKLTAELTLAFATLVVILPSVTLMLASPAMLFVPVPMFCEPLVDALVAERLAPPRIWASPTEPVRNWAVALSVDVLRLSARSWASFTTVLPILTRRIVFALEAVPFTPEIANAGIATTTRAIAAMATKATNLFIGTPSMGRAGFSCVLSGIAPRRSDDCRSWWKGRGMPWVGYSP